MLRCLELALKGIGHTKTNPMVGAVLVYNDKIIGEGWHTFFGGPHAEVHCLESVSAFNKQFIPDATLYVSLEPCNHAGKTPACTNLILLHSIKKVVVGCSDPNTKVAGNGIAFLKQKGVSVIFGVLEKACISLNEVFFINQQKNLPFIILKFAQSKDGFISGKNGKRTQISNIYVNRYVHQLRAYTDGIMVGSGTVIADNPQLNNRLYGNKQPVRIVVDRHLLLDKHFNVFDQSQPTILLNTKMKQKKGTMHCLLIKEDLDFLQNAFRLLLESGVASVLVEGGTMLLQACIQSGLWNKTICITNETLYLKDGVSAPVMDQSKLEDTFYLGNNKIDNYIN